MLDRPPYSLRALAAVIGNAPPVPQYVQIIPRGTVWTQDMAHGPYYLDYKTDDNGPLARRYHAIPDPDAGGWYDDKDFAAYYATNRTPPDTAVYTVAVPDPHALARALEGSHMAALLGLKP